MDAGKKLYKIKNQGKLSGVCAGFAEYFKADVTLVRILWALISVISFGTGVVAYIACALIMPDKSDIFNDPNNFQ